MKLKDINITTTTTTKPLKELGYILFEDDAIVVIQTMTSSNPKTGNVSQIWILDRSTYNSSINNCGSCSHANLDCYVRVDSRSAVFRAWKRGRYLNIANNLPKIKLVNSGLDVRFGAFGNPDLIPLSIIEAIVAVCNSYTGFSHNWKQDGFDKRYLKYFMASADSREDVELLSSLGIRYYLPVSEDVEFTMPKGSIVCPNLTKGITCKQCGLCNGGAVGKSIIGKVIGAKKAKTLFTI